MLLFAAIVGTICFVYGFLTYDDNEWRWLFTKNTYSSSFRYYFYHCHYSFYWKKTFHFPTVKKSVVRKLEVRLSCARCVTRNVATGNWTQHATPHGWEILALGPSCFCSSWFMFYPQMWHLKDGCSWMLTIFFHISLSKTCFSYSNHTCLTMLEQCSLPFLWVYGVSKIICSLHFVLCKPVHHLVGAGGLLLVISNPCESL